MSVCIFVAVDCPYNITFSPLRGCEIGGTFCVFGDCEIYKAEQACIYTGDENKGYPKGGLPFGSGFPIGASSTPVGTRLCWQSIVCYTFASG